MSDVAILDQILADARQLQAQGQRVRFLFDLDSTLFCVSPRTQQILRDFSSQAPYQQRFPEACRVLQTVEAHPRDWGIRQILERYQIKETISFFEAIRNHWAESFFSSTYLKYDEPYQGAVEFVNWCQMRKIEVGYLTGRDQSRMEVGTLQSLSQHGFPVNPVSGLNMKPDTRSDDGQFKLDYISKKLSDEPGVQTWFFENEPVILNQVIRSLPQVNCVFMDTVHSGREEVLANIPRLSFAWLWSRTEPF